MRQTTGLILVFLWAGALLATPAVGQTLVRPRLAQDDGPLDLLLRTTDDPDFLTARQASLRQKLLDLGVDPRQPERPGFGTILRRRLADAADQPLFVEPRQVEILEVDWPRRQVTIFRYPETYTFFTPVDTNRVGIAFEQARAVEDSTVQVLVHDLESWHRTWVSIGVRDQWAIDLQNRQSQREAQDGLLNFRIPVKIPRSLERFIGKGEATSIRISGTEQISITGESRRQSNFLANEVQQSQSLFPALEMKQSLRVNLDGTVGEKIKVRVTHDSEAIGDQATEIKLAFEGDEDDIIQVIRAGDIDVTLPGSRLLGVGTSKGGLFGVKVEGALGPLAFTLVTSKEQNRQGKASFNQSGGSEQQFIVKSTDYISERFFRLTAPRALFYDGELTPGRVLFDSSLDWPDGWRIDVNSLEVYVSYVSGVSDADTAERAFCYIDDGGRGWEDLTNPGSFDPASLANIPFEAGRFRRLRQGQEWGPLISNGELIGIALSRSLDEDNEALAVVYDIIDANDVPVRRVGRSIDNPEARVEAPGADTDDGLVNIFKLLKPRERVTPFNGATEEPFVAGPLDLTWEYMYRNFYDLRGSDIDRSSFEFQIHLVRDQGETPYLDSTPQSLPWIQVFGLDQLDASQNPGNDGQVDVDDPLLFNLVAGYLQFPNPRPFSTVPSLNETAVFDRYTGVEGYLSLTPEGVDEELLLQNNLRNDIYTRRLQNSAEESAAHTFNLVFSHASTSSNFRLNAFNIKEGSEEVILDGRQLQRGTDYTIDYFSGEINLTGAAPLLNSQSQISVNYEEASLFGGGRTSLHGVYLAYEFGKNKTLNTTWLLQSQPNSARKPKLGEEPSRNWVGNVQGRFRFQPGWVRRVVNVIPTVKSEEKVTFTTDGEVAISIPNPNTARQAYLEDFEGVDVSDNISLSRDGWFWPSLPAEVGLDGTRQHGPEDRVYSRWYRQTPGVNRGDINPELSEQERRDVIPSLVLRMQTDADNWRENDYGGIMRGFPGGLDLTQTQFLEFWVNDFTGPLENGLREGTLHFDFGQISEDFFWKRDEETGDLVLGVFDEEDQDNDNLLGIVDGKSEDTGLDGVEDGPNEPVSLYPQRKPRNSDRAGDNFSAEQLEDGDLFLYINGTERNQKLDSEDLNRNGNPDFVDGYFSLTLDLDDPDAEVDIHRDYQDYPEFINDALNSGNSWRKYRLDLRQLAQRTGGISGDDPYGFASPDLSRVRHFRIWYENPDGVVRKKEPVLVFAEMRFLGNRWLADGIRDLEQELVTPAAGEDFRVGVVNNKDNPEYVPPVFPDTRNNVAEKEQSLQLLYSELQPGHQFRVRQEIPGFEGQDFTVYGELNFFWREPFRDGFPAPDQDDLECFYWVGSDSSNYYEVAFDFGDVETDLNGWQECRLDLAELTNVKNAPLEPLTPGSTIQVRRGVVPDALSGESYRITVRGRPDLRRVRSYYAGVRYPLRLGPTGQVDGFPVTGEVLFNEVRLKEVNREIGLAKRATAQLAIPGLADVGVEWSETDPEFRGLNQKVGSNVLRRDWSVRLNSKLNNLIPLFGIDVPISASTRNSLQLPKYLPSSDVELLTDEARENERTENTTSNFSVQVRKGQPSTSKWLQYTVDSINYSVSGARTEGFSPNAKTFQKSVDSKINYDLRLPGRGFDFPLPFTDRKFRYIPNQITMGTSLRYQEQRNTDRFRDRPDVVRPVTKSKTMSNTLSLSYTPTPGMRGNWSVTSARNLILSQEELRSGLSNQKVLGLFEIGQEDNHNERFSLNLNPKLPVVRWFEPDIQYTATYAENRRPTIRQPLVSTPAPDDFRGAPRQVRNLRNNSDTTVRGKVDLVGWAKRRFAKRAQTTTQARPTVDQRRDERRLNTSRRGNRPARPPEPEPAPADTTTTPATDPEEPEEDPFAPPVEDDEEEDGEDDDRDSLDFAEEMARQQQEAAERAAEEAARRAREVEVPETGAAEPDSVVQELDPVQALWTLVKPVANAVINLQPVNATYTLQRDSDYSHVNDRASWPYRLGFSMDTGVTSRVDSVATQPFSSRLQNRRQRATFNTQTELSETIRMDMSFTGSWSLREGSNVTETRDQSIDFPSLTLRIQRVHEWPIFGDMFSNSGIDIAYRRNKKFSGATQQSKSPSTDWSLAPRWNASFPNGLDASLSGRYVTSTADAPQSLNQNRQINASLSVNKKFDAQGRLGFLRFGQSGTGSTIDMDVTLSFDRRLRYRELKATGEQNQRSGNQSYSVEPNFSYQFSRNLRAGLRVRFARTSDLSQENAVTTVVGLGLNATLTF